MTKKLRASSKIGKSQLYLALASLTWESCVPVALSVRSLSYFLHWRRHRTSRFAMPMVSNRVLYWQCWMVQQTRAPSIGSFSTSFLWYLCQITCSRTAFVKTIYSVLKMCVCHSTPSPDFAWQKTKERSTYWRVYAPLSMLACGSEFRFSLRKTILICDLISERESSVYSQVNIHS